MNIIALIDEESRFPKGTDRSLCDKLHANHGKNENFIPRKTDNSICFGIRHFAGHVYYDCESKIWTKACSSIVRCSFLLQIFWKRIAIHSVRIWWNCCKRRKVNSWDICFSMNSKLAPKHANGPRRWVHNSRSLSIHWWTSSPPVNPSLFAVLNRMNTKHPMFVPFAPSLGSFVRSLFVEFRSSLGLPTTALFRNDGNNQHSKKRLSNSASLQRLRRSIPLVGTRHWTFALRRRLSSGSREDLQNSSDQSRLSNRQIESLSQGHHSVVSHPSIRNFVLLSRTLKMSISNKLVNKWWLEKFSSYRIPFVNGLLADNTSSCVKVFFSFNGTARAIMNGNVIKWCAKVSHAYRHSSIHVC